LTDNKRAADDAEREQLELIVRCDPTWLLMDVKNNTHFDAALLEKAFELAKEQARAALSSRADGGKGEAVYQVRGKLDPDYGWTDHRKKDFDVMRSDLFEKRVLYTTPQAECAPREAVFPERDESKPAEQQGIFRKFEVRRVDGSDQPGGKHHGCRYFVLDMDHDAHAPAALRAYADSCANSHPQLAADLRTEFGKGEGVAARKLDAARGWIEDREHGDNCFVSNQYVGDQGSRCNCGKDAILGYLESDTAPQVECAPHTYDPATQWGDPNFDGAEAYEAHLEAECAPREAQPVGPRTTLNYDGTFDTTCAHCGGNGCFACLKSAAPTPERADADTAGAHIASVYEDKDGMKYVQFDIEDAEDIPIGTKLYPGTRTLTRHEVEEIAGYVEDECRACSGMTSLYVAAEAAVEETLMRLSLPVPSDEYFDAVDTETDAMLKPAAGASERADADTAGANPGWLHVDEVKALCRDFSSRTGNVYIKDVESALDGLAALPSADPTYPASERADAGKDAALTDEQKKAIAQDVHVTCSCIPGATFYNAAEMAIDAILAANKGSQNGR
jgi:hypothetical protein